MLSKQDLFERLEAGHAAAITVVTPNRRLAQSLLLDFDSFQIKNNLSVWEAADILPIDPFVARLWEDALYSDLGAELPLLLTPAQEQAIWEEILAASGLYAIPEAAAQCREAWRLLHAWRLDPARGNEDAAAFSRWVGVYRKRTSSDVDTARLPDLMAGLLEKLKTPRLLVAYAFDILPPQTKEFFGGFEVLHCHPDFQQSITKRTSFPSIKHELEAAAKWARARLEEGRARIGVVIPDLQERRNEVVNVFTRVMGGPGPFNLSLGRPLAAYPLVGCALTLLQFSKGEIPFSKASGLIRSPFLGGAGSEMARRAVLDARLRRNLDATVSLPKLIASVETCPILRKHLEQVFLLSKQKPEGPADWARQFSALLEAAGFPGERAPESSEFQARAKWHEALAEFSKLERVVQRMSFEKSMSVLKGICQEKLFQPDTPDAPIQVLGVLESAGLRFDCLWVSGLTDEAWPLAARPSPFLPIAAQKQAGIPQASAEASLEFDRRLTEEWKGAAQEVIFSCALKDEDRDLAPSPLILDVEKIELELPEYPRQRDLIFKARKTISVEDSKAPPFSGSKVRGGTRVLADQAACPFRAFARWRLAAEPLEEPAPGLDAMDRGSLVHALMSSLWGSLKDSKSLTENLEPAITHAAAAAVREFGLEGRVAELERTRLARLAREWLEVEKGRKEFSVVSREEQRSLKVAGLEFSGRIDRMDRLADGGHVLIDYKTSARATPRMWQPPRPDEPQVPIYAVTAPEELAAVAFARVRPGDMKFSGFSREKDLVPGVNAAQAWEPLLQSWKKEAESLGAAFAAGEARVDPKEALKTCRKCDLQTLCRVYEKFSALDEGAGDEE